MTENTKQTTVKDSDVKVSLPIKTEKAVFIERRVSSKTIADEVASRITGKLLGFDDIFDPKTQQFLTESELTAKGAVFITISMNKTLGKSDLTVKSRKTGNPTPFIRKTTKYQVLGNINWTSYINKRGSGDFVSSEQRSNGVENYENCKAIGKTRAENYTINGVAFQHLESTKYFDENGVEYPDTETLEYEYLKKQSKASKQKEADKHGIDIKFDPKYRTTRIDSCDNIRVFGFEYKPTDNPNNG